MVILIIDFCMNHSVKDIAKTLKDSKKQGTPVVVFTGAGCSKSAGMPLANELITEINKKYKGNLKSLTDKEKRDYGICMSKLTPHEQKTLIEKHISKAKINWAHIALASLLRHGFIGKVLTFNFDNILNRACSLDNFFPPTYDLKVLSEEYFSAIPNQSIIHLHGQWSGFQLANSDKDTEEQANKLKNYIKTTINTSPSLFIGYSGGADAFFKLVEEGFIGQHRLFWVDYANEPNINVKKFIDANQNHRNFIGEQDADKFLLELAIELKCFPTEMFKDPIKHLKNVCEYVNKFPLATSDNEIDILEDTKKTLLIADANKPAITSIKLAELLHAKKFETIINQAKNLDLKIKSISKIIASAYLGKAKDYLWQYNNQYELYLSKALEIDSNFYQAHVEIGVILAKIFEKTQKEQYIEKSIIHFQNAFKIKPNLKELSIWSDYCSAYGLLASYKKDKSLFKIVHQMYEKTLKMEPQNANLIGNYGLFLGYYADFSSDFMLYEDAIVQLKTSINLNPDDDNHLNNYGSSLLQYGIIKKSEELIKQSFIFYEKALKINPLKSNFLFNYGISLYNLYVLNKDNTYLDSAKTKIEEALKIADSNNPKYLRIYGTILFAIAKINNETEIFSLAYEHLIKSVKLDSKNTYNLACYYAYKNDLKNSKKNLLQAEMHDTLPTIQQLCEDTDLDNIRNETWFIELIERLKEKSS